MQDLALHTFTIGLNPRLSMVVRCRDPESLNDAINFAVSEEKILQTSFKRNFQQFPFNHSSQSQPRIPNQSRQPYQTNKYSSNINPVNKPFNQGQSSTSAPPVCRYCKNVGHTIDSCRKREYNNKRFRNSQNLTTNRQPTMPYGHNQPIRTINYADELNPREEENILHNHNLNSETLPSNIVPEN